MLKVIVSIVFAAVAGVLIAAAMKPDTFRVERSTSIPAPPERIFALINDFKRWTEWSPWEKKDPALKRTYGPVTNGKGAHYGWDGNNDVGQGSMDITDSVPSSRIALNIDFVKPFEGHNKVEFTLAPQGNATEVRWSMSGPAPFVSKLMQVFIDMDRMIGKDFEAGLANLKAVAEKN